METSEERIQFLNQRLALLQTTLPLYKTEKSSNYNMAKKEIAYLKNELKRSNFFPSNYLM
jgi:hypothetical protein